MTSLVANTAEEKRTPTFVERINVAKLIVDLDAMNEVPLKPDAADRATIADAIKVLSSFDILTEENKRLIKLRDRLVDGCNAVLGLLQLLSHRDDLPPEVLEVMLNNHRIDEANEALAIAALKVPK